MRIIFSILLVHLCFSISAQQWIQNNISLTTSITNASGFSIGNKGYLCLGNNSNYLDSLYEYSPGNNSWTVKSNFPGNARSSGIAMQFSNFAIVGLGWNGTSTFTDSYKYNAFNDTWDTIATYPGNGGRNSAGATANNFGYVTGGTVNGQFPYSQQLWQYDPNLDVWNRKLDFPSVGRAAATMFGIDSNIYFGLGHSVNTEYVDFWKYEPAINTWTQMANFPGVGRYKANCFVIGNIAIVGGGRRLTNSSPLSDYYAYDPVNNLWLNVSQFPGVSRYGAASFSIGNVGYLTTGSGANSNVFYNDLWEYSTSVGIQEKVKINNLNVYPNPATNELFINISSDKNSELNCKIYDIGGKLVSERLISNAQSNSYQLNVDRLINGIYFIHLMHNDSISIAKFSIHK